MSKKWVLEYKQVARHLGVHNGHCVAKNRGSIRQSTVDRKPETLTINGKSILSPRVLWVLFNKQDLESTTSVKFVDPNGPWTKANLTVYKNAKAHEPGPCQEGWGQRKYRPERKVQAPMKGVTWAPDRKQWRVWDNKNKSWYNYTEDMYDLACAKAIELRGGNQVKEVSEEPYYEERSLALIHPLRPAEPKRKGSSRTGKKDIYFDQAAKMYRVTAEGKTVGKRSTFARAKQLFNSLLRPKHSA